MGHSIVTEKATTICMNQRCNDISSPELVIRDEICYLGEGPSLEISPSSLTAFSSSEEHVEEHSIFLSTSSTQVTIAGYHEALAGCQSRRCGVKGHRFLQQKKWAGLQRCASLRT